eukprot:scaffold2926_cov399-Prasinococcus_capsulatus_cf.AAC.6
MRCDATRCDAWGRRRARVAAAVTATRSRRVALLSGMACAVPGARRMPTTPGRPPGAWGREPSKERRLMRTHQNANLWQIGKVVRICFDSCPLSRRAGPPLTRRPPRARGESAPGAPFWPRNGPSEGKIGPKRAQ